MAEAAIVALAMMECASKLYYGVNFATVASTSMRSAYCDLPAAGGRRLDIHWGALVQGRRLRPIAAPIAGSSESEGTSL